MVTVNTGVSDVLSIVVPLAVVGVIIAGVALIGLKSKTFKGFAIFGGVFAILGVVGVFASSMALDNADSTTYKNFDNPVAAQVYINENGATLPKTDVNLSRAELNEGTLKNAIVETADLDEITEMKSGDGFYKTLSQGGEMDFTAERNHSEVDGVISYEEVEGTVSYDEDSIIVKITNADGSVEVFTSAV